MTKEQVIKEVTEYFTSQSRSLGDDFKMSVTFPDDTTCVVYLKQMYEGIGKLASFANLNYLSKLLNTEKIDICDENYTSGCETCDYGSSSSLYIECKKIKL